MKEQFQERERDCACIIEWECVRACGCVWLSFCSQSATVATLSASRADNEEEEKKLFDLSNWKRKWRPNAGNKVVFQPKEVVLKLATEFFAPCRIFLSANNNISTFSSPQLLPPQLNWNPVILECFFVFLSVFNQTFNTPKSKHCNLYSSFNSEHRLKPSKH